MKMPRDSSWWAAVKNEPNFGGQMRETKPIRPAGPGDPPSPLDAAKPNMQNEPKLGHPGVSGGRREAEAYCAKRTQFAPAGQAGAAVAGANHANGVFMRNEPNLAPRPGPRRTKCAKRTQFPALTDGARLGGRGTRGRLYKTNPISRARPRPQGRGTKGESRKTNPIPCRGPGGARPGRRGVLYKQTQFLPFCWSRDRRSREGNRAKTKPISTCRAREMASRWQISARKIRMLSSVDRKLIVVGGKLG